MTAPAMINMARVTGINNFHAIFMVSPWEIEVVYLNISLSRTSVEKQK
jgi:hypothetical protein